MINTLGLLLAFDGPDGVGKTTQFKLVADSLRAKGHDVYTTHMLGGTPIGEALRETMFSDLPRPALTNLHISLATYYALAADLAARREAGTIILVDRSPLSLIAYQVYGDGVDETLGYAACDESLKALKPDMLIAYSAPLDTLKSRREDRNKDTDYFEQQQLDYHERTVEGYTAAASRYGAITIDATGSIESIHEQTMQLIMPRINGAALVA
jgi:dTMP kinase